MKSSPSFIPTLIQTVKQAVQINHNPLPWRKAISAGICSAFPLLIGLLLGKFQYGLLAGIGSFTYLYVFTIPYAQRAKRLFFVMLGMSVSVGMGTLFAAQPLASAIMVGIIGAIATFIFGALRIKGPAAIFFILGFTMATGMPLDPAAAPLRAGLVFLGGTFSWFMGMGGWLFHPHGPERSAVQKVYQELASFIQAIGTAKGNEGRQKLVFTLRSAEETLLAGRMPWGCSDQYKRLLLLNDQANTIFFYLLEHFEGGTRALPSVVVESVRAIADSLASGKNQEDVPIDRLVQGEDEGLNQLMDKINEANEIVNMPSTTISRGREQDYPFARQSLTTILGGAFDKNSIVFLTALRYGVILMIVAIIAHSFAFNRSYWITLSCAAVMSGATIISTFHRAIQRSIGTIVGIIVAAIILSAEPEGYVIAMLVFALTALTELAIVLNYGVAAFFITPNALLLAESTSHMYDVSFFASARVVDVLIGCVIGLIGTLLIGRRQASGLLPHLIAKTIRSQQQFLHTLFSEHRRDGDYTKSVERSKMQTNVTNLKLVYATATGEIPSNKTKLEFLWPVIFSIEQISYLLESCLKSTHCLVLSDETLSQLLLVFETMAKSAEHKDPIPMKIVPDIDSFSKLQKEIMDLQDALQVSKRAQEP